ncbi:MAG: restriction endonuclease subunit S [Planctomycetia bacterium]|uniref:Type I restriction modification DNA specificity domain-containing protein n=1 Tax=Candidatus Brocadia sapporoensis TaxID=392547 RepID=A0A1V6M3H7_9BACT|nr:restriction endonuclease subunit S [Candidatus Brocadia sapporoensis]MCC7237973.1 restriction endonuclease subunit S [Candidatus Brocadia sp.]OQD46979.1 hypothetical protein BIY37_00375 [Candidatus Brocadia sapporoensis]QOJ05438.1 MAG: restriction endonuclease subunit S [Planctomycetia bacterium]HQU30642.1 restriction endonuclease subunit S [Candidatus Brocadia sapporoensis]
MIDKNKIPASWEVVKLGEVCEIFQGYGFPIFMQGKSKGKIPFYKVGDISRNVQAGNQYLEFCENYIDDEELQKLKAKPYPKNTIVFAKIGEALKLNRRVLTKHSCIVDNNAVGLKATEIICSDLFLFFFLKRIKLEKYSRATTVPSVRKSDIEELEIPLPPLPEQHRIVSKIEEIFSELDKGIESLKTAQQQLKIYRQAVLKWAFEGRLTHENVKDGELPEGWKWVKLGDKGKLVSGQHILEKDYNFSKDGIPYFTGPADFGNCFPSVSKWTIYPKAIAKKNDVLITVKGAGVGKINLMNIEEAAISRQLMAFSSLEIDIKYIYHFLASRFHDFQRLGLGSTVPGIDRDTILNYQIPLCKLEEQTKIVSEIETRLSVCDKLEETITTALQQSESLRQGILKKAFEGRFVEQDPKDESASKLLERINAKRDETTNETRKKIIPKG